LVRPVHEKFLEFVFNLLVHIFYSEFAVTIRYAQKVRIINYDLYSFGNHLKQRTTPSELKYQMVSIIDLLSGFLRLLQQRVAGENGMKQKLCHTGIRIPKGFSFSINSMKILRLYVSGVVPWLL
jgi:hypothetical protein